MTAQYLLDIMPIPEEDKRLVEETFPDGTLDAMQAEFIHIRFTENSFVPGVRIVGVFAGGIMYGEDADMGGVQVEGFKD